MLRYLLSAFAALALFATVAAAEDIKGTVKSVDADKSTVVVSVDGSEKTFTVSKDAEIYTLGKGKKNKPGPKEPLSGGLGGLKEGAQVTISTFKSGEKEVVSAIKVEGAGKKPKNQ
jgi:hypothetical protein